MKDAQTIDEVIARLDEIIADCKKRQSRIGYFAALYRRMTVAVQTGIAQKQFEDGNRMEQLDVIFANRYLQAYAAYITNKPCTNAWCRAFDSAATTKLIVLQHLILGINTHINLDLGIAAAYTCPGDKIWALQKDFEKINDIIAATSQQVQDALAAIWFPLRFLRKISNKREEAVLNFSINAARKASWASATAMALIEGEARENYIAQMDKLVVEIAQRIIAPGFVMGFILKPVLLMESKSVSGLIDILDR